MVVLDEYYFGAWREKTSIYFPMPTFGKKIFMTKEQNVQKREERATRRQ